MDAQEAKKWLDENVDRCGCGNDHYALKLVDGAWTTLMKDGRCLGKTALLTEFAAAHSAQVEAELRQFQELLERFDVGDTDALKHRLEDWERWRKDVVRLDVAKLAAEAELVKLAEFLVKRGHASVCDELHRTKGSECICGYAKAKEILNA